MLLFFTEHKLGRGRPRRVWSLVGWKVVRPPQVGHLRRPRWRLDKLRPLPGAPRLQLGDLPARLQGWRLPANDKAAQRQHL